MSTYSVEWFSEVEDFVKDLPFEAQDKVLMKIDQLEKHGRSLCQLSKDIIKKIGNNLYELRIKTRDFFCRIFFTFKKSIIYLILAYNKKSNTMPEKILKLAKQRQKELGC